MSILNNNNDILNLKSKNIVIIITTFTYKGNY